MKLEKLNKSPKKRNDESLVGLTEKQKAEEALRLAKEQEVAKFADPNFTAEIVPMDNKTNAIKWRKADQLMNSL